MKSLLVLVLMLVSITCIAKKKKVLKEVLNSNVDSSFTIENERYEIGVRKVIWIDYLYDARHCELEMPYSSELGRIIFSITEMGSPVSQGIILSEVRSIKVSTNLGDFIFLKAHNTWIAFQQIDQTEF